MKYLALAVGAIVTAGVGYWLLLRAHNAPAVATAQPKPDGYGTQVGPTAPPAQNAGGPAPIVVGAANQLAAQLAGQQGGVNLQQVAQGILAAGVPSLAAALSPTDGKNQPTASYGQPSTQQAQQIIGRGVGTVPNSYTGGLTDNGGTTDPQATQTVDQTSYWDDQRALHAGEPGWETPTAFEGEGATPIPANGTTTPDTTVLDGVNGYDTAAVTDNGSIGADGYPVDYADPDTAYDGGI